MCIYLFLACVIVGCVSLTVECLNTTQPNGTIYRPIKSGLKMATSFNSKALTARETKERKEKFLAGKTQFWLNQKLPFKLGTIGTQLNSEVEQHAKLLKAIDEFGVESLNKALEPHGLYLVDTQNETPREVDFSDLRAALEAV